MGAEGDYRVIDRPGPGLAVVAGPDGRASLWSRMRNRRAGRACANCGGTAGRAYRPSLATLDRAGLRLCAACVEGGVPGLGTE